MVVAGGGCRTGRARRGGGGGGEEVVEEEMLQKVDLLRKIHVGPRFVDFWSDLSAVIEAEAGSAEGACSISSSSSSSSSSR
jgi:hypothetical protein